MQVFQGNILFYDGNPKRIGRSSLNSKIYSLGAFIFVLLIHSLLIFNALKNSVKLPEASMIEPHVNLILFSPEKPVVYSVLESPFNPIINSEKVFEAIIPDIKINDLDLDLNLDVSDFNNTYELPNKKRELYKDVFDPKLRKKLQDLPKRLPAKPKIQYLGVGVTLESIGDGKCIYGDAFNRTGFIVKCGPDQGEQMMLNVEQAINDPLGLKQ